MASKRFSDFPKFEYTCPNCNVGFLIPDQSTFNRIEPPHSIAMRTHDAWDANWTRFRFTVTCKCNKKDCGEVAFATGDGSIDLRYGADGDPEYYEYFTIRSFFPSPRLCYIPAETPFEVTDHLEKSFALYWVDISAAANAMRNSLEFLLDEMGVPKVQKNRNDHTNRMNLHRRLEVWSETNQEHAQLCHALREVGNLGSHGDVVTKHYYESALEIYSFILKQLFEDNSQRMKELAQTIQNGIKAKASLL